MVAAVAAPAPASAEALLLIDVGTGKVLQADNATMPWYPASTSKLMTTYVTLTAIKEGRLSLDTLLTVSANAVAQQPSKMGFKLGTQLTVDNALKMLMVKSANDMAVVLAEGVSGSVEKFAAEMNATSQRLGMTQSSWVNPNGLPDEGQITSARDMAILARALIHDFPEYDFYWHIPAIKLGKRVMRNFNTLINRYPGADGMKTGFICASGFNLVASATRGNRRLIAVVFGAPSSPVRAAKAAALLEYGFSGNGLAWLMPSLGTVENLAPINATPPDLREEMCGKHRRRPAAEEADDDEIVNGDSGSPQAFMLSNLKGSTPKPSSLIGPLVETQPPIPVFVGPPRPAKGPAVAIAPAAAASAPRPAARKPAAAVTVPVAASAAKPAAGAKPTPAAKSASAAKPAAHNPTEKKPAAAKPAGAAGAKPAAASTGAAAKTHAPAASHSPAKTGAASHPKPTQAEPAKPKTAKVKPSASPAP